VYDCPEPNPADGGLQGTLSLIKGEGNYILPKLSDFSLLVTSKILDSCFRRNDDYQPMNENVIPVKTGIQKGLSIKNSIKNRSI
jgi:hypothetical protein